MAEKQSLLEKIIDGAIDAVKKPFVIKRVERAFSSASDSLEEQILTIQSKQTKERENLVQKAKDGEGLSSNVQNLINLQVELEALESAKKALAKEEKELVG